MNNQDIQNKAVLDIIKEKYDSVFNAERKIMDFVLENPQETISSNISQLAKLSNVSAATVVRMCHDLGYDGYYQFRIKLASDLGNRSKKNENMFAGIEGKDALKQYFMQQAETMIAIGNNNDVETMHKCVKLIKNCKHAHILAVGNTCQLAQYMGFRLGRLGIRCTYNVAAVYFMNHINLAEDGDILIAISKSGTSKQVVQGMELGKEKGLKRIAITAYTQSPVSELADHVLISNANKTTGNFDYYKEYAHLNEMAVIDVLLNFLTNFDTIETTQSDKLEYLLSGDKI